MSLGGILVLVLLVISLFVFIYLVVITSKSWGILQTVLLCILFIECWVFLLFTGRALDKRLAMLKEFSTASANVEKLKKDVFTLTYGGDNVAEAQDALIPLAGQARRLTADRGRVWRNVAKAGFQNGTLQVELTSAGSAAADPNADPTAEGAQAPAASAATIPQDMIVYAFSLGTFDPADAPAPARPAETVETNDTDAGAEVTEITEPAEPATDGGNGEADATGGKLLPKEYIGEFKVTQSAPGEIALQPVSPLSANQLEAIDAADAFVLYEALPQDSHDIFLTKDGQPTDEAMFGTVDGAALNQLLQAVPAERRPAVLSAYLRDGGVPTNDDPTANVWLHVEVVKPLKLDVDGGKTSATEGTYYDINGRTVDSRLMLGAETKEVTVAEGKQLLLPQSTDVSNYINNGDLKLLRRVFVRPLNAYELGLTELRVRLADVQRLLEAAAREEKLLQEANALNEATRQAYLLTTQKLVADRDQYQKEIDALTADLNSVTGKVKQTRDEMTRYWRTVHSVRDQMVGQ